MCRGRGSNPHDYYDRNFLRVVRLPFRHPGLVLFIFYLVYSPMSSLETVTIWAENSQVLEPIVPMVAINMV